MQPLKSFLVAAVLSALASNAYAQSAQIDGTRPPTVTIAQAAASPQIASQALPQPDISKPPYGDVKKSDSVGVLAPVLNQPPLEPKPKQKPRMKAPPNAMTVEPGRNYTFGVALGHINRVVTPFAKPSVRTTSTASTSIEGSIIYVASQSEDPIGLFIFDEVAPEMAISLTLMPSMMPPVSTTIAVNGYSGVAGSFRKSASPAEALAYEGQHPYLETLTDMLKGIAQGKIPDGYGYEEIRGGYLPGAPSCTMPGINVQPRQLITGSGYSAIVAKATNMGAYPAEIREELCKGTTLRAVASWPYTSLAPGQSTELYMVLSDAPQDMSGNDRPSVISGGR